MRKFVIALAVAAAAAPAFAQSTAVVDPAAPVPGISVQQVVAQCELVAADSGTSASGQCVGSTQTFLDGLAAAEPAVRDQNITDLVVAIAPLVQDDVCNAADEEVAQAIRLASTKASDPEQVKRLIEIADTVEACTSSATAAIEPEAPEPVPASAA
jgi:hypothetical protein